MVKRVKPGKQLPSLMGVDDSGDREPRRRQVVKEEMKADWLPLHSDEKDIAIFVELGIMISQTSDVGVVRPNTL